MGACVRRTGLEAREDANQASNQPGGLLERMGLAFTEHLLRSRHSARHLHIMSFG